MVSGEQAGNHGDGDGGQDKLRAQVTDMENVGHRIGQRMATRGLTEVLISALERSTHRHLS